jgi:hypothetical protein
MNSKISPIMRMIPDFLIIYLQHIFFKIIELKEYQWPSKYKPKLNKIYTNNINVKINIYKISKWS